MQPHIILKKKKKINFKFVALPLSTGMKILIKVKLFRQIFTISLNHLQIEKLQRTTEITLIFFQCHTNSKNTASKHTY